MSGVVVRCWLGVGGGGGLVGGQVAGSDILNLILFF